MDGKSQTRQWPQYLAAITATISMAITGSHIGWTSPVLPVLKGKDPDSPLLKPLTSGDGSWMVSFSLLGSIPGNLLAAMLVNRIGRKGSLLMSALPMTIGWLLIIFGRDAPTLLVSRFVSGIGQGMSYVVCPMYIGEIADKEIRGSLGTFIKLMVTIGELYAHAIGPFVPYSWLAYSCVLIPAVFFLTFTWMPESPYYLLMRGRKLDAENSLRRLKRHKLREDLVKEMDQMQKTVTMDLSNRGRLSDLFSTLGNRRAVLICFGLQSILQLSGIAAIESYTQEIFDESKDVIQPGHSVIILSVMQLIAGLGAAGLVDRLGRKPLLLVTTVLAGVTLGVSAGFYYFKSIGSFQNYGMVLIVSVVSYELIIALGLNPLPYMMLGELFPTGIKGLAVSLANLWASLLAFVVSKMHQVLADAFGLYTSFACYSSACFIGILFIVFVVPETKGKSLAEIQVELNREKKGKKLGSEEMQVYTIN